MKSSNFTKKNKIVIKKFNNKKNLLLEILPVIKKNKYFLISGGKTFFFLLNYFSNNTHVIKNKFFYLTDERLTLDKKKINYYNLKNTFKKNFKKKINDIFFDLKKISNTLKFENLQKEKLLKVNNAFIGVGNDGHIASIFRDSKILKKKSDLVYLIKKKNENFNRITLSIKYISNISNIFLIVYGKKKRNIINILKKKINTKLVVNDLIRKSKKNINIYYI